MKTEFTLEVAADNNFSVLNRIINVLNRRRIRIVKLLAHEDEDNFRTGKALILVYTSPDLVEKAKHQLEKLIEVEQAHYHPGSTRYFQISEQKHCRQYLAANK